MNEAFIQLADRHFQEDCGLTLDTLLAPIPGDAPGGHELHGDPLYREVLEARREDDPTLPLGPWAYELKRADWDRVTRLTTAAIAERSKDLQFCVWLLEAQVQLHGFSGIAPSLVLIGELCERYWPNLHPAAEGDDLEARGNIFEWINEKLLPTLRLVPIAVKRGDETPLSWDDWERANRNEQLRSVRGDDTGLEGGRVAGFTTTMAATATDHHLANHGAISAAVAAIDRLDALLDRHFGRMAPSLSTLRGMLEQIRLMIEGEVKRRGITPGAPSWLGPAEEEEEKEEARAEAGMENGVPSAPTPSAAPLTATMKDRADAYARLSEVAEFLMRIEPHSPVPALLRRAVEWGEMNTRELYEELFLRLNGQLNIFELLGVEFDADQQQPQ